MRRSARGEQSAFSLFPFLAVLLCTMGAMVVLLVAMAYVSRQKAIREAEAAEIAAAESVDPAELKKAEEALAQAAALAEQAAKVRQVGQERLEQEQSRLSGVEDHLRRLKDEIQSLVVETQQVLAAEEQWEIDQQVAEAELERLNKLIGVLEDEIERAKHAASGRERKYAVVPLREGNRGTIRPAAYFECTAEGVVLQPEGIEITHRDLMAPQISSPVGAASRTVDRYYAEHPEARAANEAGRPYPLLIVRPGGVDSYYLARTALELAGVDYGYQPVESDWSLEYGDPNPVLAQWLDDAIADARYEREALAETAPQLARELAGGSYGPGYASAGAGVGTASSGGAGQQGPSIRVRRTTSNPDNPFEGLSYSGSLPGERTGQADGELATSPSGGGEASSPGAEGGSGTAEQASASSEGRPSARVAAAEAGDSKSAGLGESEPQAVAAQSNASGPAPSPTGEPQPQAVVATADGPEAGPPRGNDPQAKPYSQPGVPIIRPIQLLVADDRVAVLTGKAEAATNRDLDPNNPRCVVFPGATSEGINDLVSALEQHAESWGIAGKGMYWDPRMVLNVAPDGAIRADEVRRLLEAAGLQVQAYPVATASQPGARGATR